MLKPGGFVDIECPDVMAVVEAMLKVGLEGVLYQSPSGPIRPLDVLFGHQKSVAAGNSRMAHKTAFTRETLEAAIRNANFQKVAISIGINAFLNCELGGNAPDDPRRAGGSLLPISISTVAGFRELQRRPHPSRRVGADKQTAASRRN